MFQTGVASHCNSSRAPTLLNGLVLSPARVSTPTTRPGHPGPRLLHLVRKNGLFYCGENEKTRRHPANSQSDGSSGVEQHDLHRKKFANLGLTSMRKKE